LLNRPELIIADEPTTALDVTIQGADPRTQMQRLCRELGTALMLDHPRPVRGGRAWPTRWR
jgi:peptide/nickel transport system ATP-binding protein